VISELHFPITAKFLHEKFYGPEKCKIWHNFGSLQILMANISGTDEDIKNWTGI